LEIVLYLLEHGANFRETYGTNVSGGKITFLDHLEDSLEDTPKTPEATSLIEKLKAFLRKNGVKIRGK
jgi:hypothetical protein